MASCWAKQTTILISIDGFAHHYLEKYQPKNILQIANEGVLANGMEPVFPTKTFPNHVSIVTGEYPQDHGIFHNKFYNREIKKEYKLGDGKFDSRWLTATPIWAYAEQHGLKSAIYFWPESETKVNNNLPNEFFEYKHHTPNSQRIDQIISWLERDKKNRPDFIAGYFSTIDSAGHSYGRDSKELKEAISNIDIQIGRLYATIQKKYKNEINLILVSDHGMELAGVNNGINWQPIIKEHKEVKVVNGQTQLLIYEENEQTLREIHQRFVKERLNKKEKKFNVYLREDYPNHWHMDKVTPVTPDLIVTSIAPYTFLSNKGHTSVETHGYDFKTTPKMAALFIANGPAIKEGEKIGQFQNIHIFPLMGKLLKLPEKKDISGKLTVLKDILK